MAYTAEQQARIDTAKLNLENRKTERTTWRRRYSDCMTGCSGMQCYEGVMGTADEAEVWFNPTDAPCNINKNINGCHWNEGGKGDCKDTIATLNRDTIPELRKAYQNQILAEKNLNDVYEQIKIEVANDPETLQQIAQDQAEAQQEGMTKRTKYIVFGIIIAVVIVVGVIIWFRLRR